MGETKRPGPGELLCPRAHVVSSLQPADGGARGDTAAPRPHCSAGRALCTAAGQHGPAARAPCPLPCPAVEWCYVRSPASGTSMAAGTLAPPWPQVKERVRVAVVAPREMGPRLGSVLTFGSW